jgi:molybdenum cofactor biosynthesis enzyme MoaA
MSNEYGKKWKKTRLKRVRVSGESLDPKRVFLTIEGIRDRQPSKVRPSMAEIPL